MKFIFKHSTRCPVSARAKHEVDSFLEEFGNHLEYQYVDVIQERTLSNQIAEKYGIRHESPQVIIVNDQDEVIWHASHYKITRQALKELFFTGN